MITAADTVMECLAGRGKVLQELLYFEQQRRRLSNHARWELNPYQRAVWLRQIQETNDPRQRDIIKIVVAEGIHEWSGTWRLAICFLVLLNAQDFVASAVIPRAVRSRIVAGNVVPFLEHHLTTLRLPRKVVVRRMTKALGDAIPRRRHMVDGHWSHRHGVGDANCEHVFVNVTEHAQRCMHCQYYRWWRDEYERGDASLGYVTKDRVVQI